MENKPKLPAALHDAYNWTDAAGELHELRSAEGDSLERYCAESEANCRAEGDGTVTASALLALHDWLAANEPTTYYAVAGQDFGTCEALGWAWTSVAPFVVAKGDDEEDVVERAAAKLGHDDVRVHAIR
jgi:hypothetical protein